MASAFELASQGVVRGAERLSAAAEGRVSGLASDLQGLSAAGTVEGAKKLANDVVGVVTGTSLGEIAQDVGGEVLGSVAAGGGLLGTLAGALGGLLANSQATQSWGNLNPKLIANLFACDASGITNLAEQYVMAPISDVTIEFVFNWQSPFENTGPESKAPALMAMLQTGHFGTVINALQTVVPDAANNALGGLLDETAEKAKEASKALEGRTGITKLNSRQVFSGMPPVKINMTLHLRALKDPETEIHAQYQRLLRWSLPQQLAADSTLTGIIKQSGNTAEMVKALFPSIAPMMVGMVYGGQSFKPMVLESLSNPLDAPRYRDGKFVYLPIQMTLSTLTALDRADVLSMFL